MNLMDVNVLFPEIRMFNQNGRSSQMNSKPVSSRNRVRRQKRKEKKRMAMGLLLANPSPVPVCSSKDNKILKKNEGDGWRLPCTSQDDSSPLILSALATSAGYDSIPRTYQDAYIVPLTVLGKDTEADRIVVREFTELGLKRKVADSLNDLVLVGSRYNLRPRLSGLGTREVAPLLPNLSTANGMKDEEIGESGKCSKDVGLDPMNDILDSPLSWSLEFQRQRREIIELWQSCNVSLVHRTYFFLLFNGDPTDNIYLEVELRRLYFLKETFSQAHPDRVAVEDGHAVTPASSKKALRREREMLIKRMQKRLSVKERENLYQKWSIGLETKQRRHQLVERLWSKTEDMDHIMESAAVVAKLVGMMKPGHALKEMFGLSFLPSSQRSYSWRHSLSSFILQMYSGEPSRT